MPYVTVKALRSGIIQINNRVDATTTSVRVTPERRE